MSKLLAVTYGKWVEVKEATRSVRGRYIGTTKDDHNFSVDYEGLSAWWKKDDERYDSEQLIEVYDYDVYSALKSAGFILKDMARIQREVDVIIRESIYVPNSVGRLVREKLVRKNRFVSPRFDAARKFGRIGNWDGYEKLYSFRNKYMVIPVGKLKETVNILKKEGFNCRIRDERNLFSELDFTPNFDLRDYQMEIAERAISRLRAENCCVIVSPAGSGKTEMGIYLIAHFRQPTLILVHTLDLQEQWIERIESRLGYEAGGISGQGIDIKPITVALVQSMQKMLPEVEDKFGMLILDECQHTPAETFKRVVRNINAKYKVGLSATPERVDGLHPYMFAELGNRIVGKSYTWLVKHKYLMPLTVKVIKTGRLYYGDYRTCVSLLTKDRGRDRIIAEIVRREAADNHKILILSERKMHCRRLEKMLKKMGIQTRLLISEIRKKDRIKITDDFRKGNVQCLVATQLADEGLDLPILDRTIFAFPSRAWTRVYQRCGRSMRMHSEKKDAVVYDLLDIGRKRGYERKDYFKEHFQIRKRYVYDAEEAIRLEKPKSL